jgi:hypothetical protein
MSTWLGPQEAKHTRKNKKKKKRMYIRLELRSTARLAAARDLTSRNCRRKLVNYFFKPIYGGTGTNQSVLFHLRPGLQQADVMCNEIYSLNS